MIRRHHHHRFSARDRAGNIRDDDAEMGPVVGHGNRRQGIRRVCCPGNITPVTLPLIAKGRLGGYGEAHG